MTAVLTVAHLDVRRDALAVVQDVTFNATRGERVALMGPSGSGKTTVLRAIAGLQPRAGGTVTVNGAPVAAHRAGARHQGQIGMVFQFHHLFEHLSALQNVALAPVHVGGELRVDAERRAQALLDKLGVGARARALPHELSGGEAQRVAIARALAMRPPLLLMDEPTASLDPARRGELAATMRDLSADGTTLLIATHDAEFARACVDRVLLLQDGRVVREGKPGVVLS